MESEANTGWDDCSHILSSESQAEWFYWLISNQVSSITECLSSSNSQQRRFWISLELPITGSTVLHQAAQMVNLDLVAKIMNWKCGANFSRKNKLGETPLHMLALARGYPSARKQILAKVMLGCESSHLNPLTRDIWGRRAVDLLPPEEYHLTNNDPVGAVSDSVVVNNAQSGATDTTKFLPTLEQLLSSTGGSTSSHIDTSQRESSASSPHIVQMEVQSTAIYLHPRPNYPTHNELDDIESPPRTTFADNQQNNTSPLLKYKSFLPILVSGFALKIRAFSNEFGEQNFTLMKKRQPKNNMCSSGTASRSTAKHIDLKVHSDREQIRSGCFLNIPDDDGTALMVIQIDDDPDEENPKSDDAPMSKRDKFKRKFFSLNQSTTQSVKFRR
ncbi:uncharacterized protein LOC134839344 isoform X2 [Symsagittifera roscoffensis]|uniref:uncharacterized protein LOC134839344 isoform X2 n=1 Tax=Symsagittifera roscoffensis TaxID=84072 RepID=UPI00307BE079